MRPQRRLALTRSSRSPLARMPDLPGPMHLERVSGGLVSPPRAGQAELIEWESVRRLQPRPPKGHFHVDVRPLRRDNLIEGGMTALPNAMATRDRFLTTVKALERALRQAEFDGPATDSAPFPSTTCSPDI